jgi:drug/metabolite transporter (DMT)-like permease
VAVATLGEPIGSATLAYLFLGETPTLLKISGAAFILAGIALTLFASPTARPMDATIN